MSLAGLKKQLNKANQFVSEKIGSAQGTPLEDDIIELEKKTDVIHKVVDDIVDRTEEFLQPNPAHRAKLKMLKVAQKEQKYPQTETVLSLALQKGKDLGEGSFYADGLRLASDSFHELSLLRDNLETEVHRSFLDPLYSLQNKDLKEISQHRKKLEGRRLDYDCKKRKDKKVSDDDLKVAEEKFEESKELCYNSMMDLVDYETEMLAQLLAFVTSMNSYHSECMGIFVSLEQDLRKKLREAENQPKAARKKFSETSALKGCSGSDSTADMDYCKISDLDIRAKPAESNEIHLSMGGPPPIARSAVPPRAAIPAAKAPSCKALFKFDAEDPEELGFEEGEIIKLLREVDENWLEGELRGRRGIFPSNFVQIVVPLPK